jgi:hypothetical protein
MDEKELMYEAEGQAALGGIVSVVVLVGVAVLVLIFVSVLSGQTYNISEASIDDITNTTIQGNVRDAVGSGFEALTTTGQYMPLIVTAVVIGLVLAIVLGFASFAGVGGRNGGGAL